MRDKAGPDACQSAQKDFRRRLLLVFLSLPAMIVLVVSLGDAARHTWWAMVSLVPPSAALIYMDRFRCPRCGGLYRGRPLPARPGAAYGRGCCVRCGLCLFKKDKINWRLR